MPVATPASEVIAPPLPEEQAEEAVTVRPVEPRDRPEWLRLLLGLYPGSTTTDHAAAIEAFLAGSEIAELVPSAVFVAERDGDGLCGCLELSVRDYAEGCAGATPYVESWFVDPDHRGRGVGRLLMQAAEDWAREHGYPEIASDTLLDNRRSQSAHRALGFEEVERSVHFRKTL
jgi:aminoglycoside 6'-N-acetyltransferase I